MKTSRNAIFAKALVALAGLYLVGALSHRAFGLNYTGCVSQTLCVGSPPSGCICVILYPYNGSQADNNGGAPDTSSCAYVSGYNPSGWGCGSAIPDSAPCH
jgi:hypothetical protein